MGQTNIFIHFKLVKSKTNLATPFRYPQIQKNRINLFMKYAED